jgi:ATP-binding cassette subfamily B protein/ATP-binding cassette subfamily C protein
MTGAAEPEAVPPSRGTLRKLLTFARPHRAAIAASLALGALGVVAALAQPITVGLILEAIGSDRSVVRPATLLVLLLFVDAAASGLQSYLMSRTGEGIVLGVRRTLISRILHTTVPEHDRHRAGDLISRVGTDTTLLNTALARSSVDLVLGALTFVGAIILMATIDPLLLLVTLLCISLATAAILTVASRVQAATKDTQDRLGDLAAALERVLRSFRTVKISRAEGREEEAVVGEAQSAYQAGIRAAKLRALVDPATVVAVQGSFVLVLGIGGARLATGDLALADLVAFLLYLLYLVTPLLSVFLSFTELQQGMAALGRLEPVLSAPVEDPAKGLNSQRTPIASEDGTPERTGSLDRKESVVCFNAVNFGYTPERPILHSVSFEVHGPALAALVGPSGSGKSTVFALLARFYEPDSGTIMLDGADISELPLQELRGRIGYVEQDSPVMAGSIRRNLLYANPEATEEELNEAVDLANLRPFIEQLPQGLDTEVGEGGIRLSGGERQRIAIARMLLVRPSLLLLDEVTSQLDAANERALREAITEISNRCIVMAIAHRLSTVARADMIIVLNEGKVVATGTHEDLMESDNLYRELVKTQLIDAETSASRRTPRKREDGG